MMIMQLIFACLLPLLLLLQIKFEFLSKYPYHKALERKNSESQFYLKILKNLLIRCEIQLIL